MTDWIDFLIYAAFLVVFWFIYPRANHRLAIPILADRNPQWVADNPDTVRRIRDSRWFLWLCHALGAVSLVVLTAAQLGMIPAGAPETPRGYPVETWMVLWNITVTCIFAGLLVGGAVGLYYWFGFVRRHVPVASRRQATLVRRSINDFAPRWLRYLAYGLIALNLVAWTVAGIAGTYSTPLFWTRYAILIGLTLFFWFFTRVAVNRRPNVMDRIFGPGNRRTEVRFNFTCLFLPPVIGAVRLYEEVNDTALMDINRAMFLTLILMLIHGLLRTVHLPPRMPGTGANRETAHDISPA